MKISLQPKTSLLLKLAGMWILAAWLTGCVTAQPLLSDEGLIISDISPDTVRMDGTTGSVVRWGGTIAGINNLADGSTAIELVSRPLRNGGRPIHNDKSAGRFIAETTDFLDPEIVKVGRDFTVIGVVTDIREGKIGEAVYQFPVVAVDRYHYWSKKRVVPPTHFPHWNDYSPYRHDPFWRSWPYPPHRHSYHPRSAVSASFVLIKR